MISFFTIPFSTFAMSSVSSVNSYSNYSEQELLNLIAKLQKQLEELRNNTTKCNLADVDLSLGDGEGGVNKEYVKNLQNFLKEKGYFSIEPTGYFGKITKNSLINFQKASNLSQTGELDVSSRNYIKTLNCNKIYSAIKVEEKKEVKTTSSTHSTPVSSITLTGNGQSINWVVSGYSKNGYKIVWSKNPNPTYPTRNGDKYIYLSDPNANNTTLDAFSGTGTYYVRVCEYTGSCGVYSNEITVSL